MIIGSLSGKDTHLSNLLPVILFIVHIITSYNFFICNRQRLITEEVHDTDETSGKLTEAGMTVLHRVAAVGSVSILEALLDSITNRKFMDIKRKCNGDTPLHIASSHGRTAIVNYLGCNGADVNAKDAHGRTPLHHVSNSFDEHAANDIINILSVRGAEVNSVDNRGTTPLHVAAEVGQYKTVMTLLKQGANPRMEDNDGRTALHCAQMAQSPETTQLLIKYGACVDRKDSNGDTPLALAVNNLVKVAKTPSN